MTEGGLGESISSIGSCKSAGVAGEGLFDSAREAVKHGEIVRDTTTLVYTDNRSIKPCFSYRSSLTNH